MINKPLQAASIHCSLWVQPPLCLRWAHSGFLSFSTILLMRDRWCLPLIMYHYRIHVSKRPEVQRRSSISLRWSGVSHTRTPCVSWRFKASDCSNKPLVLGSWQTVMWSIAVGIRSELYMLPKLAWSWPEAGLKQMWRESAQKDRSSDGSRCAEEECAMADGKRVQ